MVVNLRKADAYIRIGMDYDSWADGLMDAARNSRIVYGAPGFIDTSVGIERLEVPQGKVDAGMGHVHLYGNPHYWLDPHNARVITKNIAEGLSRVRPESSGYFNKNREEYLARFDVKIREWETKLKPYQGKNIVTYHKSWEYFARRFGLNIVATVEPKPGIPPSAAYLNTLIQKLKGQSGIMILHENCYPARTSRMVAAQAGARLLVLPVSVGGMGGKIKDYPGLFDHIIASIAGERQ
jgi:zinc/manganese transport system substrate-binding protein